MNEKALCYQNLEQVIQKLRARKSKTPEILELLTDTIVKLSVWECDQTVDHLEKVIEKLQIALVDARQSQTTQQSLF